MGRDFHASFRILIALQEDRLQRLHCSFITHFIWHILQRNKSFFLPFLLVGPEIHNSTHSFLFYDILNFVYNIFFFKSVFSRNVFWYGFPGCYKCNSSKTNWDVLELFSIPAPTKNRPLYLIKEGSRSKTYSWEPNYKKAILNTRWGVV